MPFRDFSRTSSLDESAMASALQRRQSTNRISYIAKHDTIPEEGCLGSESLNRSRTCLLLRVGSDDSVEEVGSDATFKGAQDDVLESPRIKALKTVGRYIARRGSLDSIPVKRPPPSSRKPISRCSSADSLLDLGLRLLENTLKDEDSPSPSESPSGRRSGRRINASPHSSGHNTDVIEEQDETDADPVKDPEVSVEEEKRHHSSQKDRSQMSSSSPSSSSGKMSPGESVSSISVSEDDSDAETSLPSGTCDGCAKVLREIALRHKRSCVELSSLRRDVFRLEEMLDRVVQHTGYKDSGSHGQPADKPDNMRYSIDNLADITEEAVLEKLLDEAPTYEERRSIRGALRELRKKKRDGGLDKAKDKTPARTITTNERLTPKSDVKDATKPASGLQRRIGTPLGDSRANKTSDTKSLSEKYSLSSNTSSTTRRDMSSSSAAGSKKIGSIFDRGEDDAPKKSGSRLDLERRQAERRRDLQRNRSMPATSTKDARKMFAKMDIAQSGESKTKKVGRSPTFVVPNANNVKQMLLKWCQAKTRGYEHVDINNFSGSWANGMAFCALVHNFFPQAFDYNELDPKNRAHNFDLAFKTAHEKGDIPELLDTEDLVRMREPDWKCVYTYIMEFYKQIRELGMT